MFFLESVICFLTFGLKDGAILSFCVSCNVDWHTGQRDHAGSCMCHSSVLRVMLSISFSCLPIFTYSEGAFFVIDFCVVEPGHDFG